MDLNVSHPQNAFRAARRLVLDQTAGHHSPQLAISPRVSTKCHLKTLPIPAAASVPPSLTSIFILCFLALCCGHV